MSPYCLFSRSPWLLKERVIIDASQYRMEAFHTYLPGRGCVCVYSHERKPADWYCSCSIVLGSMIPLAGGEKLRDGNPSVDNHGGKKTNVDSRKDLEIWNVEGR